MVRYKKILGIRYFVGSLNVLLDECRSGGLVVVPSAPGLADLPQNAEYREALENATFAITDSSLLVLLWFFRTGEKLIRISGLQFLRAMVGNPSFRTDRASFWIMPSKSDLDANVQWLKTQGINIKEEDCYIAPLYSRTQIRDDILLARLEKFRPLYIVINIGGGTQEILGYFLYSRLSYRPAIICTGAAIAFLSGRQAKIPHWADKIMLAWLVRCITRPAQFVPRYFRAFRLITIVFRFAERPVSAKPA